jgi:transcriptional regulator with XRE-family HTH domain
VDIAALIRKSRERAGMTQVELAQRAETSQPTLATYESGATVPRLETLERILAAAGFELELDVTPVTRRGAEPIATIAPEFPEILKTEGGIGVWRRLLDFVDDFRWSPLPGKRLLTEEAPVLTGVSQIDALVAGIVDVLFSEVALAPPAWTQEEERVTAPWWFVAGMPGFEAMAVRDTPVALARHGVFINEGDLVRV